MLSVPGTASPEAGPQSHRGSWQAASLTGTDFSFQKKQKAEHEFITSLKKNGFPLTWFAAALGLLTPPSQWLSEHSTYSNLDFHEAASDFLLVRGYFQRKF